MASTFHGESAEYRRATEAVNLAFSIIFGLEAAIKIVGFGWKSYIKSGWNKFDFLLVVTSAMDIAFAYLSMGFASTLRLLRIQKVLRLMRISRMFKLMKGFDGVRSLLETLIMSLPAFWNVGLLLVLAFFIYAYTGVLLFGSVRRGVNLNENANFEKFSTAMITLFRVATNDQWRGLMEDCMVQPPDCDKGKGDCGTPIAAPYFMSFVVVVSMIMFNLFTAVIRDNFEDQQDQDSWHLNPSILDDFVDLWHGFDDGSNTISIKDFKALLVRLPAPMGIGRPATQREIVTEMNALNVPMVRGRLPFFHTLFELVKKCSEVPLPHGHARRELEALIDRSLSKHNVGGVVNISAALATSMFVAKWRFRNTLRNLKARRAERAARKVDGLSMDSVRRRGASLLRVRCPANCSRRRFD
ncbi:unnamed protein product [Ostreobium quekettii]|uniref:Ion transport domain-containing protein n=1 Tax=Ostreobium quekettii TaxID=121088 RepID=A0A8S1J928_9CHLO|nr:unnamed protein product [Ostreobium quekettii]